MPTTDGRCVCDDMFIGALLFFAVVNVGSTLKHSWRGLRKSTAGGGKELQVRAADQAGEVQRAVADGVVPDAWNDLQ